MDTVNTNISGGSINEDGWGGPTWRTLLNCAFKASVNLLAGSQRNQGTYLIAAVIRFKPRLWHSILFCIDHADTSWGKQLFD